jgi:hypothetical protein
MNETLHDITGTLHEKTPSQPTGKGKTFQNFKIKDSDGLVTRYTTYDLGLMETLSTMVPGDKLTVYFKIEGMESKGGAWFNNLFAKKVRVGN